MTFPHTSSESELRAIERILGFDTFLKPVYCDKGENAALHLADQSDAIELRRQAVVCHICSKFQSMSKKKSSPSY